MDFGPDPGINLEGYVHQKEKKSQDKVPVDLESLLCQIAQKVVVKCRNAGVSGPKVGVEGNAEVGKKIVFAKKKEGMFR
jgi:hypothetical protein